MYHSKFNELSHFYTQFDDQTVLIETNQFSISFVCTQFKCQNCSVWPMDRTLSSATTAGQSGPGSNCNEGVLRISRSFSITGASPLNCLVSYQDIRLRESYPSAEMQSVIPKVSALLEPYHQIIFVLYSGHSMGDSGKTVEMQSVYSTVPADWDCTRIGSAFHIKWE